MPAYSTGACIGHSDPAEFCGPDTNGNHMRLEEGLFARTVYLISVFCGAQCQLRSCRCKSVSEAAEDLLVQRPSQSAAAAHL